VKLLCNKRPECASNASFGVIEAVEEHFGLSF